MAKLKSSSSQGIQQSPQPSSTNADLSDSWLPTNSSSSTRPTSFIKADTRPMIERYAQAPSDQATLVLRGSKWNKGKLDEEIANVGLILKCDSVDEGTATRWIQARCTKAYESSIDPRSAAMLVERLGCDLGRIDSELAKLATAAGRGNPITPELIVELVGMTREDDVWAIQSYLLCGDAQRTLGELDIIMNNGSKGAHVPVSFACTDLARKLLGIAEGMNQGVNPNTLAKDMKNSGGQAETQS